MNLKHFFIGYKVKDIFKVLDKLKIQKYYKSIDLAVPNSEKTAIALYDSNINVVDLIDNYTITLTKKNDKFVGLCPYCGEKSYVEDRMGV